MTNQKQLLTEANTLLGEIGELHGMAIELDEGGKGYLQLENKYDITLQLTESGNNLKFVTFIGNHQNDSNPDTLEYLLNCNYEAYFLKSCTIGLCKRNMRFTVSYITPLRRLDTTLLNNIILNFGSVVHDLDVALDEKMISSQRSHETTPMNLGDMSHIGF